MVKLEGGKNLWMDDQFLPSIMYYCFEKVLCHHIEHVNYDSFNVVVLTQGVFGLLLVIKNMICITGPYRCTNQLSVWYVPSCIDHIDTWYTKVYRCTRPYRSFVGLVHTFCIERYVSVCQTLIKNSTLSTKLSKILSQLLGSLGMDDFQL